MTTTETPERCARCEHPHGTCHHTAPALVVGDRIHAGMSTGRWVRAGELRPNSRVRDAEGSVWVRTRHRDRLWERIEKGPNASGAGRPIWELYQLVDERQGYGPLTVEHVAGRRNARRVPGEAS